MPHDRFVAATAVRRVAAAGAAWLALAAAEVQGQTQPPAAVPADPATMQYLVNTPTSLLDLGLMRLGRDLERALDGLGLVAGGRAQPIHGALIRFDRRIVLYASVVEGAAGRTDATCDELFGTVRDKLLSRTPQGSDPAQRYLDQLFGLDARGDEPGAAAARRHILDTVLLEITLRTPAQEAMTVGGRPVVCAGRLDAERPVPVQPYRPAAAVPLR